MVKRLYEEVDEVHCLECDNVYPEGKPIVEVCPVCGNTDRMRKTRTTEGGI